MKSQAGRWNDKDQQWTIHEATSPCIDAGVPNVPLAIEPFPNGGRINMGVYGGTSQASMSESTVGNAADCNNDAVVNAKDMLLLFENWLREDVLLGVDVNRDGIVNLPDAAEMMQNWLWQE